VAFTERYVRADAAGGGDGTTDTNSGANGAWTLAEAVAAVAAGQRVNVKVGTYALTTTTLAFATAGTTTAPIMWRGFSAVIGDLDADPSTTRPTITFTTGRATAAGAHQIFRNLVMTGAPVNLAVFSPSGGNVKCARCRFENTQASASSRAVTASGTNNVWRSCRFKATTTATSCFNSGASERFSACVFTGGAIGCDLASTPDRTFYKCVFRNLSSHGILFSTALLLNVISCTFSAIGGDGIRNNTTIAGAGMIVDCIFRNVTGTAINNNTGTDTNVLARASNTFYACGTTEAGFGDSPNDNPLTETVDPFASDTNLSLVSGAVSRQSALPGLFEDQTFTGYGDRGAVQGRSGRRLAMVE
jgi:hypothetical protein